ncbi:MAG TPA: hypothetical protein VFR03_04490 [Thermoanaerobaculia bacterium]|nr:hypothetical protein [Thermoanaerobaculia bacterium]
MSKQRTILVLGLALLGLAASALPGRAASRDTALGESGEVYQVKAGSYGDLFPAGRAVDPGVPVLALDVTRPGAPTQRVLIPDTLDPAADTSASLIYENDSQTVYALWASLSGLNPVLKLSGFDGTSWSTPIQVVGNPYATKGSPQFTITRETFQDIADDGTTATKHRTTLHLLWQEEVVSGAPETFYTPVVFVDGVYTGINPVYNLSDYLEDASAGVAAAAPQQTTLLRAPTIQAGRDQRTVIAAFTSTGKQQLATVEIDVLPEELSRLAEKARSHIIEIGRALYPGDLPSLAEKARSHIIEIGVAYHPELVTSIADQVRDLILANGGAAGATATIEGLAEKCRSHIIEIGAKLSGRGLRDGDLTKIVQVDDPSGEDTITPAGQAAYLLQIRLASSRPTPRVGPGTVKLFVSEDGGDVLVSWAQADKVLYRLSRGGAWSDSLTLNLSPTLDINKAYDILGQRVRNR